MKHILAINYSQSGQLNEIVDRFSEPFKSDKSITIEYIKFSPKTDFPFPWTNEAFWNTMPSCVLEEGLQLAPFEFQRKKYDLIILGYQVWFLSVSQPTMGLLQHNSFKSVVKDTPIVTIIGARNMWLSAQESVKKHIRNAGGALVANIPLIDRTSNLISAITILYWMLSGKKKQLWGIFPYPGVDKHDIEKTNLPGKLVLKALNDQNFSNLQQKVHSLGQIHISTSVMFIELRAKKIFNIWANLIRVKGSTKKKQKFWIKLFKYYIIVALFIVSPILVSIYKILILPLTRKKTNEEKKYYYGLAKNLHL